MHQRFLDHEQVIGGFTPTEAAGFFRGGLRVWLFNRGLVTEGLGSNQRCRDARSQNSSLP